MTRTAVLRDPSNPSGTGQFGAIQAVASSFGVEVSPLGLHDAGEIEHGLNEFARTPNGVRDRNAQLVGNRPSRLDYRLDGAIEAASDLSVSLFRH